eukprot:397376-Prorocentrum_minimum.AAC.1
MPDSGLFTLKRCFFTPDSGLFTPERCFLHPTAPDSHPIAAFSHLSGAFLHPIAAYSHPLAAVSHPMTAYLRPSIPPDGSFPLTVPPAYPPHPPWRYGRWAIGGARARAGGIIKRCFFVTTAAQDAATAAFHFCLAHQIHSAAEVIKMKHQLQRALEPTGYLS